MYEVIQQSLNDFKSSYKSYLSFEFFYMLITSFVYVPLTSFIFNRMLKWIGSPALLNAEVYQIALSLEGLLGLILITLLAVCFLFIEFGVLILIAQKRYFDSSILVTDAFATTLFKLPRILGFGIFYFIGILIFVIPFIDSSNLPALLDFNLSIVVTSSLHGSYLFLILYLMLFLLALYLIIRLVFTLHFILIEEKSVWKAIKDSFTLTQSNHIKILVSIVLFNIVILTLGFTIMNLISYVVKMMEWGIIGHEIQNYFITISSYVALALSLLFIPLNLLMLTRLFYNFKKEQEIEIIDPVEIKSFKTLNKVERLIKNIFPKKKYTFIVVLTLWITGLFFLNHSVTNSLVYLKWDVSVASHRGDVRNGPENSLSSLKSAFEQGVDTIEIDVQLTKDGVVVLNHDKNLKRVSGFSGSIQDLTYEEVKRIDIGKLYGKGFVGEKIPTLDEVLELVDEEGGKVIIDIKATELSRSGEFADRIVASIQRHELQENTYVQAFDYSILQMIREREPEVKIGHILYLAAGNLSSLDVDFYTIRQTMLSERFVQKAHKLNREVWVWTVNLEQNIKEVLKYDIDGIITDYPERVQNVIGIEFADSSQDE